jgi:hypothetical protein
MLNLSTLRTEESEKKYHEVLDSLDKSKCVLCTLPAIKTFRHWKIVLNDFPYDRIAEKHHMIVPLRHISEHDMDVNEALEFQGIKHGYIAAEYQYMIEPTPKKKSIPEHFHVHLIVTKK